MSSCHRARILLVDLDTTHRVLRITVTTVLTDEAFKEIYRSLSRLASQGGPYAAILDFSQVVDFPPIPSELSRQSGPQSPLDDRAW
jgi:hypothetical protein